jgi:hypothetical protein
LQPRELAAALEALAARLGIPVRYEVIDHALSQGRSSGGLCRLRGQPIILLDASLGPRERVAVLARALASFDLDGIYLPPLARASSSLVPWRARSRGGRAMIRDAQAHATFSPSSAATNVARTMGMPCAMATWLPNGMSQ